MTPPPLTEEFPAPFLILVRSVFSFPSIFSSRPRNIFCPLNCYPCEDSVCTRRGHAPGMSHYAPFLLLCLVYYPLPNNLLFGDHRPGHRKNGFLIPPLKLKGRFLADSPFFFFFFFFSFLGDRLSPPCAATETIFIEPSPFLYTPGEVSSLIFRCFLVQQIHRCASEIPKHSFTPQLCPILDALRFF